MSLRIIMGVAGSGKTTYAFDEVVKIAKSDRNKNVFVLVPDQFSQEATGMILERMGVADCDGSDVAGSEDTQVAPASVLQTDRSQGIMNIDVLSFKRLAFRALEEYRGRTRTILTDEGKIMLLRKIFIEHKNDLEFFTKGVDRPGFLDECKSILSEFLEYDISDDDMTSLIDAIGEDGRTSAKLRDLKLIYDALEDRMGETYRMSEELIPMLAGMVEKLSFLKNATICLDDFTGFTPVQYELIRMLMKHCDDVIVTVTTDGDEARTRTGARSDMFTLSLHTIEKLTAIAREEGVEIAEPVLTGYGDDRGSYRLKDNPALRFVERHIFSYDGDRYPVPEVKADIPITIHSCRTPAAESAYVATQIRSLISDGVKPERIAVVSGEPEMYAPHIARSFDAAGISFFLDLKKSLGVNPLTDYLMSFLEMRRSGYSFRSVMRFLRGGLSPLSHHKVDNLENYMLATGRRGFKAFTEAWVYDEEKSRLEDEQKKTDETGKDYLKKRIESRQNYLDRINESRQKFIESVKDAEEGLKGGQHTVREFSECMCGLMIKNKLRFKLEKKSEELRERGEILRAAEYLKIYDAVLAVFDMAVELLGDETVSLDDYIRIIRSGFSEGVISFVPYTAHQVTVGDVERTRLREVDYLFFMGNVDNVFPKVSQIKGLLTQAERERIESIGVTLAPGREELYDRELFYMYRLVSRPEKHLYLTYPMIDDDGESLRPSYLINSIKGLFSDEDKKAMEFSESADDIESKLEIYGSRCSKIDQDRRRARLSVDIAAKLYGDELRGSVTRFEKFALCPYAHFLRYGLHLDERPEYKPRTADSGNIFHNSFEELVRKMKENNKTWKTITVDELKSFGEECFVSQTKKYRNDIFHQDKRTEYAMSRFKKVYLNSLVYLKAHMGVGKFEQKEAELSFPDDISSSVLDRTLSSGKKIKLFGKIDRLDTYDDQNKRYIKIVDYKSSARGLSMAKVYHGLELQLLTYMKVAMSYDKDAAWSSAGATVSGTTGEDATIFQKEKKETEIIPAAALFQGIEQKSNPWNPDMDDAAKYNMVEKYSFRPNGYVNADCYDYLDNNIPADSRSFAIPIRTTKTGKIHSVGSKCMTSDEFEGVMKYTLLKIDNFGERILDGDISVKPCLMSGSNELDIDACRYCEYSAICGIEGRSKKEVCNSISIGNDKGFIEDMLAEVSAYEEELEYEEYEDEEELEYED